MSRINLVNYQITAGTILVKKEQYVVELPSSLGMKTKPPFGVVTWRRVTWNLRSLRVIWGMYSECHKTILPSSTYIHVQHLATVWVFVLVWFSIGRFLSVSNVISYYNIGLQCFLY